MKVDFEIVEIYYNNICAPFTKKRTPDTTEVHYAIKIGNEYYHIGQEGMGVHICDIDED